MTDGRLVAASGLPPAGSQPYPGYSVPVSAAMTEWVSLISLPQQAYTATVPSTCTVDTSMITYAGIDINLVSFQGGTTPSITYFLERSSDGGTTWFPLIASGIGAFTTAQVISGDLSPALTGSYSAPPSSFQQHVVFSNLLRLRWTLVGSPTSVTFSASLFGR